jgi:hypothetical protein
LVEADEKIAIAGAKAREPAFNSNGSSGARR